MKLYKAIALFSAFFLSVFMIYGFRTKMKPPAPPARLAFWNVENLFDTIDDPSTNDEDFLPGGKLKWNTARYTDKLAKLSKVILEINNGNGPDMLGLAEIENRRVLEDLVQKTPLKEKEYGIVHYDSPDKRGIDVAFLYRKKSFSVISSRRINVSLPADTFYTRDILLVKGVVNKKDTLCIFVNHWPSRRGGKEASDEKRMHAAKQLRAAEDSILRADPRAEILAMGDFNDEPTDPSIVSLAYPDKNFRGTGFINLMDSLKAAGEGSYHYKKEKNLIDQIMVTQSLKEKKTYCVLFAHIFKPEWMTGVNYKDDPPGPLHTYAGSRYIGGYSDHFPVFTDLIYYPANSR